MYRPAEPDFWEHNPDPLLSPPYHVTSSEPYEFSDSERSTSPEPYDREPTPCPREEPRKDSPEPEVHQFVDTDNTSLNGGSTQGTGDDAHTPEGSPEPEVLRSIETDDASTTTRNTDHREREAAEALTMLHNSDFIRDPARHSQLRRLAVELEELIRTRVHNVH